MVAIPSNSARFRGAHVTYHTSCFRDNILSQKKEPCLSGSSIHHIELSTAEENCNIIYIYIIIHIITYRCQKYWVCPIVYVVFM